MQAALQIIRIMPSYSEDKSNVLHIRATGKSDTVGPEHATGGFCLTGLEHV
jgi:hypothetical protein